MRSVKDRIALAMIETAEREGKLRPGKEGHHRGADLRQHGHRPGDGMRRQGLQADLDHAESMSLERRRLLKAMGAELVLTPRADGMRGAVEKANEIHKNGPTLSCPSSSTTSPIPQVHYETLPGDPGGNP
jgi:cysteine synthase A